jgi:hypothetical protein
MTMISARHTQTITASVDLTASVDAARATDGSIELTGAELDERNIRVPWNHIENKLEDW